MIETNRTIEVDEDTAAIIGRREVVNGVSAAAFAAALVRDRDIAPGLDDQWRQIEGRAPTISHTDVVRWLETWGTSTYRPWPKPR